MWEGRSTRDYTAIVKGCYASLEELIAGWAAENTALHSIRFSAPSILGE
jgi:hypothetical protein